MRKTGPGESFLHFDSLAKFGLRSLQSLCPDVRIPIRQKHANILFRLCARSQETLCMVASVCPPSMQDSYDPEDDLPLCIRHQKTFNAIALLLYVALGVSMLSLYEQWSFVTSFYVIVQIVTTVGYGDIAPSRSGELFLAFYVMLGTVLVASILNSLIESIVEASQAELADSLKETRDSVVRSISRNKIFSSKVLSMYWKRTPVPGLVTT